MKADRRPRIEISLYTHPPKDWMKVMSFDPGNARGGLLCGAVPPPPAHIDPEDYLPDRLDIWAEVMLYNPTAQKVALTMKELTGGWLFETFIMDEHFGRTRRDVTSGDTVREQYAAELAKLGVMCRKWGSDFEWGTDKVDARELMVKEWMVPREGGRPPVLRIHRDCTNLHKQLDSFYRKKNDPTQREKNTKKPIELVDALEYLVGHFNRLLYYVPPEPALVEEGAPTGCHKLLREWQRANWQPFTPKRNFGPTFGAQ